jgi:hypothetical protein
LYIYGKNNTNMAEKNEKKSIMITRKLITNPLLVSAIRHHSESELCSHQESVLYFLRKGVKFYNENVKKPN